MGCGVWGVAVDDGMTLGLDSRLCLGVIACEFSTDSIDSRKKQICSIDETVDKYM